MEHKRRPERWFIVEKAYVCVKQQDMSDLGDAVSDARSGIYDDMAIASCSSCNHSTAPRELHGCCTLSDRTGICPSLPGEEVGCSHGVRPAFGRPVVPSWDPITSQGQERQESGERAGELLLCGEAGRIYGWKHREELRGGREGHPPAGRSEGTWTEIEEESAGRKQGGEAQSPQSSVSQGRPSPCQVWGNAMHWSQSASFWALLLLGGAHTPRCHLPFSCRPA